jgi:hypothetical protein
MRKRRVRRNFGDSQNLTPEDRKAMQTYRDNCTSRRYYSDLDAIDLLPKGKPKTTEEPK